jgi:hypothetical protein
MGHGGTEVNDDGLIQIPAARRTSVVEYVNRRSAFRLVAEGLCLYLGIVLLMTCLQSGLIKWGLQVVRANGRCVTYWLELIYFNFVTVLTIGYGDYVPVGFNRVLITAEALAGVGIFGALVGVVVVKAMLPKRDSIVFSRYCYGTCEAF